MRNCGWTSPRYALSPSSHLDPKMPPVLVFHGDADPTVTNRQSIVLRDKLLANSNICELVTVPGGSHGFTTQLPEWKEKARGIIKEFLAKQKLLPAEIHSPGSN